MWAAGAALLEQTGLVHAGAADSLSEDAGPRGNVRPAPPPAPADAIPPECFGAASRSMSNIANRRTPLVEGPCHAWLGRGSST
jgi:hypothetical protein